MKLKLSALSFLLTVGVLLTIIYIRRPPSADPVLIPVGNNLFITSQINFKSIRLLQRRGIGTIVDIRPDDEEAGETPSSTLQVFSQANHIDFHYVPVPHESIPDEAVNTLAEVLAHRTKPTVLYCHSGRRAVRTLALAEASRVDGPNTDAICEMVRTAGFSADDLKDKINQRISHRTSPPTDQPDGNTLTTTAHR